MYEYDWSKILEAVFFLSTQSERSTALSATCTLYSTSHKETADSAIAGRKTGQSSLRVPFDRCSDVAVSSPVSNRPFFIALFRHLNYVGRKGT